MKLVKDGKGISRETWTATIPAAASRPAGLVADGERISEIMRQGYTLTVAGVQKYSTGIRRLCFGLESELSHHINANIYFTPPSSQGFASHFDDHDVLVLQLEGEKEWQVFGRQADDYRRGPQNVALADDSVPLLTCRLKTGDSLYVPRGFVHSAAAADQPSIHVSVGIIFATVGDLLQHMVNKLQEAPDLARPLDAGFTEDPLELSDLLTWATAYLRQRLGDGDFAEQVAASFCRFWGGRRRSEIAELVRDPYS
jgi:bifunctional lysine-specific demethylase and histidyl-hydroxylase NO66